MRGLGVGAVAQAHARLGAVVVQLDARERRLVVAVFGHRLGLLYHGCDDVADVRGSAALGGGSEKDISDGILTLPAALAIRDPAAARLFARRDATEAFTERLMESLDDAEDYLDRIAMEAANEARENARMPARLLDLIDYTRELSRSE